LEHRQRLTATVHGYVQGVGFRGFVRREATRLGLTGYVRNVPDGSVEVVAEGSVGSLDALARALRSGPLGSQVTRVDEERRPVLGDLDAFDIAW
jgi:acylphosphatase